MPIRYNYPFANMAEPSDVWMENGFDVQQAINATRGTILEIGGPADQGYYFLKGCTLPRRPVITNVNYEGSMQDEFLRGLYPHYIDQLLDIREPGLPPRSVGICLTSCLDQLADEPHPENQQANEQAWQALSEEDQTLTEHPEAVPKVGLRFMLVYHAREFLEAGGLLIAENLRDREVHYALALGNFALRATAAPHQSQDDMLYQSIILQRK